MRKNSNWSENLFKKMWPYWLGGIGLGLINILSLYFTEKPLRVTSSFLYWAVGIYHWLGGSVKNWFYFQNSNHQAITTGSYFINDSSLLILGAMAGALLSVLLASRFKVRKIKNKKQLIFALLGGIIMGYGTRIAKGCNIGALLSGASSLSVHGWVFGIFMFVGVWLGLKVIK